MPTHGPTLADAYLKTTRAKEHLDALRAELAGFRNTNPIRVFKREDRKRGRYELRITTADAPDRLPLILGDLLYCLRSALDQLTWSLAKLTTPYPQRTQFPIFEKRNAETRRRFAQHTTGVPARAAMLIERLQPYHRPDPATHLLARLDRLGNIDKHRRIPVHSNEAIINFPKMPRALAHLLEYDHDQHLVSAPLELKDKMTFDPMGSFRVVFGDTTEGIACDVADIASIYEFVTNTVLPRFARFFK